MDAITPAPQQSATQRVYDHVKAGILSGAYPAGELLTEGRLGEESGVSRTPVREALLRLEAEGMVRLYPKKGAMVVPVSAQEATDVLEARTLVETFCAPRAWAARHRLVEELRPFVEAMRAHRDAGDVPEFAAADRCFHERIVAAAGNEVLTRLYRGLRERQLLIQSAAVRGSAERMDVAVRDHEQLLAALQGDEEQTFLALTRAHLDRASAYLGRMT